VRVGIALSCQIKDSDCSSFFSNLTMIFSLVHKMFDKISVRV
jgi:hypothetical protein